MLLLGRDLEEVEGENVDRCIESGGPVESLQGSKNGRPTGTYYYRIIEGYRNAPPVPDSIR